jgi:hypothetical protein
MIKNPTSSVTLKSLDMVFQSPHGADARKSPTTGDSLEERQSINILT